MSDVRADPASDAVETVRRWYATAAAAGGDVPADRLAALLRDPDGPAFALGLVDRVLRADDARVAGRELEVLSRSTPGPLPWWVKGAAVLSGGFAPLLPRAVGPTAHAAARRIAGHLVLESTPAKLGAALAQLASGGAVLDLHLLGEPVLGRAEADHRLRGVHDLLSRDDVERLTVAVSDVVPPASPWAFDATSDLLVERLRPLFASAAERGRVVHLDAVRYRDLDLAIDVVTRLLDLPELARLEAGVTLQAALPDSVSSLRLVADWARQRVARGGAPVRVRLEQGRPVPDDRVEALLHDWPSAASDDRAESDAALLRLVDEALRPEHGGALRVGLATADLFAVASARATARQRGMADQLEVELPLGTAPALVEAVRADAGRVVLRVPVVRSSEFPVAADHLARRVLDAAAGDDLATGGTRAALEGDAFERAAHRHLVAAERAARAASEPPPSPRRRQDRSRPGEALELAAEHDASPVFVHTADTDPALDRNRAWVRRVLDAARDSRAGAEGALQAVVDDETALDEVVTDAARAAATWGREEPETRAELLDMVAEGLASRRDELVEVAVSETGATFAEADRDVSDAVDAARWQAVLTRRLGAVEGAVRPVPPRLTVVLSPGGLPVSTPVADVLAALAAGGAVVLVPSPTSVRCAAVVADVLRRAGVPRSLFVLATEVPDVPGSGTELRRRLVAHPAVDAVVLTGSLAEARELRGRRHDLPLRARAATPGSIVVTPSADLDAAVADVVTSAFARAGTDPSSISHVLLVGSAATSERFRRQLVDAVGSLRAGPGHEATTQVGPLREPASGPLLDELTTLAPGESWLVEPRRLDAAGRLWQPGLKTGVDPSRVGGAPAGPVLGLVAVGSLDEAIALQSGAESRAVAGLHSLDQAEVETWLWSVDAGQLSVRRPTTGTMTRRRPAALRGRAAIGPVVAAGGPSTLVAQGTWAALPHEPRPSLRLTGVPDLVVPVIEASRSSLSFEQFDHVRAGALSDQRAWEDQFGAALDVSDLVLERNVLRHRPQRVVLRLAEGADPADLVRLVAAGTRARARLVISSAAPVPSALVLAVRSPTPPVRVEEVVVESDEAFLARLAAGQLQPSDPLEEDAVDQLRRATGVVDLSAPPDDAEGRADAALPPASAAGVAAYRDLRIRLVGGDARALLRAVHGSVDVTVWSGDVTEEGQVELLPFLAEQAVSVTAHRHGVVDPAVARLRI